MLVYGGYMSVKSVFGFFYRIGSNDYPTNYDPNKPFGFNGTDETPVFNYSINDVENALISCRNLVHRSFFNITPGGELETGANESSDVIIADSTGGYSDIVLEDIHDDNWKAAFKIVEFLYNNQSKVFLNPSRNEYFSWGDEMLASQFKPNSNEENIFYNNQYDKNSLSYTLSSLGGGLQGRIEMVSFSVSFKIPGGTASHVLFRLYFDADAFVERNDNISYKVYQYEDEEEPVDQISPREMRDRVVGAIFGISGKGKYKTVRDYFVDKRISDQDDFVREQFFVFSTLKRDIDDAVARLAIKQFLIDKYNNDIVFLRYTYPSLFDENEVHLIPMYDNLSAIIQDETNPLSESNLLYPLSLNRLNTELLAFGYNISPSHYNYKPIEVFHVGPGNDWVPSSGSSFRYLFPIIAVELDSESGITLPISERFPNYRPVYGSEEGGKASEFHSILVKLFEFMLGIAPTLDQFFKQEYNVVIYDAGSSSGTNGSGQSINGGTQTPSAGVNRKRVSFTFNGDLWLLYGPLGAN
jgi:hypothetical protein